MVYPEDKPPHLRKPLITSTTDLENLSRRASQPGCISMALMPRCDWLEHLLARDHAVRRAAPSPDASLQPPGGTDRSQ